MKKYIFIFFVILISVCNKANGQFINKFGIKGGIILSQLSYNSNFSPGFVLDPEISYSCLKTDFGLFGEFFDSRSFCTSVEIHYLTKGEGVKNPLKVKYFEIRTTPRYVYVNDRLNYLSFQILPRWKFLVKSDDKMYFFGGITFNIMVSNTSSYNSTSIKIKNDNFITGLKTGFGIELWELFLLELSYSHDFTNAYVISYGNEKLKRRHDSFELIAGLSLKKILRLQL